MEILPETQAPEQSADTSQRSGRSAGNQQYERLQVLVCELLEENQKLRTHARELEQRAVSAERGLSNTTLWAGALL